MCRPQSRGIDEPNDKSPLPPAEPASPDVRSGCGYKRVRWARAAFSTRRGVSVRACACVLGGVSLLHKSSKNRALSLDYSQRRGRYRCRETRWQALTISLDPARPCSARSSDKSSLALAVRASVRACACDKKTIKLSAIICTDAPATRRVTCMRFGYGREHTLVAPVVKCTQPHMNTPGQRNIIARHPFMFASEKQRVAPTSSHRRAVEVG